MFFPPGTFWSRQAVALVDLRMFRKKKKKRPEISAPKNFEHRVHTSFDAKHGCFVGLPTQWQSLIENLRRPKPMVDPSRITEVELRPKKVHHTSILSFFNWSVTTSTPWHQLAFECPRDYCMNKMPWVLLIQKSSVLQRDPAASENAGILEWRCGRKPPPTHTHTLLPIFLPSYLSWGLANDPAV